MIVHIHIHKRRNVHLLGMHISLHRPGLAILLAEHVKMPFSPWRIVDLGKHILGGKVLRIADIKQI
jgi:hypothetical protein